MNSTAVAYKKGNWALHKLQYPLFLFLFGSVFGWCLEVVFRSVCHHALYIPGFLMGPYCPIYGFGVLIIVYLCSHQSKVGSYLKIFALSSGLEYLVSLFFEKTFDRLLWDYSNLPLSIGTRVSLAFSLVWGALGLTFLILVEPKLKSFYIKHEPQIKITSNIVLGLLIMDVVISVIASYMG